MKLLSFNTRYNVLLLWVAFASAETTQEAICTFERHSQSSWLNQINQQTEMITRNPKSSVNQSQNLIMEKPSDNQHRQKLEAFYQTEDFYGLQSFGEHRATQLETEQSPEGEAWRLLNQSPERYYPDVNEHKILGAMELGVNALEHHNTWSKQKDWPTDAKGQPIYDRNSEMSVTIARMRQHFKGCDYQKKLILKSDRQVHSPDIKECTRALITDHNLIMNRKINISSFLEYVSGSGLSGIWQSYSPATLKNYWVYIDTETTGLSKNDEVLEIAIINDQDEILLNTLVKPVHHTIWPDSQRIHHISPAMVHQAPTYDELRQQIESLVREQNVIIYIKAYDSQYLCRELACASAVQCCINGKARHIELWQIHKRQKQFGNT